MSYRPSVIAALLALLATPASAGNVIDPDTLFPPTGGGAIAWESNGTVTHINGATNTSTAVDLAMPSGLATNDLLIATTVVYNSTAPTTAAPGWTSVGSCTNTSSGVTLAIFQHLVTTPGSEPSTITIDQAASGYAFSGVISRYSNATSADAISCETAVGVDEFHISPNVTPTAESGMIHSVAALRSYGAVTWVDIPATEIVNVASPGSSQYHSLAVSVGASSGTSAQGSKTFESSIPYSRHVMASVALH